jgi:hypothetical protein
VCFIAVQDNAGLELPPEGQKDISEVVFALTISPPVKKKLVSFLKRIIAFKQT